jgi:hypothetical protein
MSTDSVIMVKKNETVVYGYCRGTQTDPSIFDYHKFDYVVVPFHHYDDMCKCYYNAPSTVSAETIIKKKVSNKFFKSTRAIIYFSDDIIQLSPSTTSSLPSEKPSSSADHNDLFEKTCLRPRPPPKIKRLQRSKKQKKNYLQHHHRHRHMTAASASTLFYQHQIEHHHHPYRLKHQYQHNKISTNYLTYEPIWPTQITSRRI